MRVFRRGKSRKSAGVFIHSSDGDIFLIRGLEPENHHVTDTEKIVVFENAITHERRNPSREVSSNFHEFPYIDQHRLSDIRPVDDEACRIASIVRLLSNRKRLELDACGDVSASGVEFEHFSIKVMKRVC